MSAEPDTDDTTPLAAEEAPRAAVTGPLAPPPAPGATADLTAAMMRRGRLPAKPEPESPKQ